MSSVCLARGMSGESGAAILTQDCVTTCFCLSSFSRNTGIVECFQFICLLASLCLLSLRYLQEFSVYLCIVWPFASARLLSLRLGLLGVFNLSFYLVHFQFICFLASLRLLSLTTSEWLYIFTLSFYPSNINSSFLSQNIVRTRHFNSSFHFVKCQLIF